MTKYSLNFRNTAGSWGETPPSGAVRGSLYPSTIAGLVCGWNVTVTATDYAGATNAKLSGRNSSNLSNAHFRIDLPNGPGQYRLWLALGALNTTINNSFAIRDGAGTVLRTIASTSVPGSATAVNSRVMDASGAVIPYNDYISTDGGTPFVFTATSDHIRIERNAITIYLVNVMLENVEVPLSAAILSDEFGVGTHSGSIHPKEPQGHRFGKITSATGIQNYSIVGASQYFALEQDGNDTWLVATSTRIPDAWTGDVTVRQTAGAQTRDTTFSFTAGTLNRPVVGILGKTSSETIIQRNRVKSVMNTEGWPGYRGQTFVNDLAVTDGADFITKLTSLPATGWHRLRLQNGTYTGIRSVPQTNWADNNGGVLIEPDTGHNPIFSCVLEGCQFRGVHFRGVTIVPPLNSTDAVFKCSTSAPYAILLIDQCKIGNFYAPGFDIANWTTWGLTVLSMEFCEEVHIRDCDIVGIRNAFTISGGRRLRSNNNRFRLVAQDFHAFSSAFRFTTPRGVFADDRTYVEITGSSAWHNPDIYTGLTGGQTPHCDWLQIRRTGGAAYPTLTPGVNGSQTTPWTVGVVAFNPVINRLYTVTAVTGNGLIDIQNPPTGTGTGIVSGNVTFNYLQDYNLATEMVILLENNCLLQDGLSVNLDGNAQPNVQFLINSNAGWNNTYSIVSINNICASPNIRGINGGSLDANVHAEWNTFVAGAIKALDNDQAHIEGRIVRAHHNIVGLVSGRPNIVGSFRVAAEGNVAANFQNNAVAPNRPGDVMQGSFINYGNGIGWGYVMTDDGTVSADEFRSAMSRQLHHIDGSAGARLKEIHTVTVGGSNFELVISNGGETVPGQMLAPTSAARGRSTVLTITKAADPQNDGPPITSYDLRYSTDGNNWTDVLGATFPYELTGLTPGQNYHVQTRAVNFDGPGLWSPSVQDRTSLVNFSGITPTVGTGVTAAQITDGWLITLNAFSGVRPWSWNIDGLIPVGSSATFSFTIEASSITDVNAARSGANSGLSAVRGMNQTISGLSANVPSNVTTTIASALSDTDWIGFFQTSTGAKTIRVTNIKLVIP